MFLQSPEWEAFQWALGRKTWRVDEQLVIRHKLPFGFNYLYCPRPHINNADSFFAQAQEIALKEKAIFLKIDPIEKLQITNYKLQITNSLQPQRTIVLDLSKSEEELLSAMHEKTRYNIRLAERKGVKILLSELVEGIPFSNSRFETFWNLLQETARRDKFHTHEQQYYQKLFAARSQNFSNELFFVEYQGKVLAAALVNFYRYPVVSSLRAQRSNLESSEIAASRASPAPRNDGDGTATYLHGASSRAYKEVMAPYLLHWHIIKTAKERGFRYYDFWGIDDKKWLGVTRFKTGFGGQIVEYPAAINVIYRSAYHFSYSLMRKFI